LSDELRKVVQELEASRISQLKQQEEMRIAFLRGVSALNAEAMSVFKKDAAYSSEYNIISSKEGLDRVGYPEDQRRPDFVRNPEDSTGVAKHIWVKDPEESKYHKAANTILSTRGLVTRHYRK
jgi:hypothetical protein